DLAAFSDFEQLRGIRLAGRASGSNRLEWPSGRFDERRGDGHVVATPPAGVTTIAPAPDAPRDASDAAAEWGPFAPVPLAAHLPGDGEIPFRCTPDGYDV